MRIVFGWNHFKIKSFDPYELGLSQKTDSNFRIEIRQSYFHLFWIPFFGLGKKWAIRKDNQLYEMPAVLKDAIKGRNDLQVKSPWYTFTGPLLIVAVLLGVMISEKVDAFRSIQWAKADFSTKQEDIHARFRKPSPDDYYKLVAADGYTSKYAQVTGIDKKNIQLTYINRTDVYLSNPAEIANAFVKYANETETISIGRGDSTKIIASDYNARNTFEGITIKDKYGTNRYRIESIVRVASM
jgi:hypothetical protein